MLENTQAPTKVDRRDDGQVWVHSIFSTIQGEGPFAGVPAVFVRLAGCNLQCPFCDTEYSEGATLSSPTEVLQRVREVNSQKRPALVVITGGEPFRQNLYPVCKTLLGAGHRVQIETNGTLYQQLPADERLSIVCSPKTGTIHRNLWPRIVALKYVARQEDLNHSVDGLPSAALGHGAHPFLARPLAAFAGKVYLQPADEQDSTKNLDNLRAVQRSCMLHGHTLCLQLHKIIGVP
jgi:7-carboxy-7-deazaguanine synthase